MTGKVIVISGPSGVGKGTVSKGLFERMPNLEFSVSCTTRAKRDGEIEGVHYHYISVEEFRKKEKEGDFLETTMRYGNYYGTDKSFIQKRLEQGANILLDIDVVGAMNVKQMFPFAILIFLAPPSLNELYKRIEGRGSETPEQLTIRKRTVDDEMKYMPEYDFVLVNDDLERCVNEIVEIINTKIE